MLESIRKIRTRRKRQNRKEEIKQLQILEGEYCLQKKILNVALKGNEIQRTLKASDVPTSASTKLQLTNAQQIICFRTGKR